MEVEGQASVKSPFFHTIVQTLFPISQKHMNNY